QVTHTVHTFEDTRDLFAEVFGARIYAGFHYSHSLVDGGVLGRRIARQLFDRHFRTRHREVHEAEGTRRPSCNATPPPDGFALMVTSRRGEGYSSRSPGRYTTAAPCPASASA